LIQPIQLLSTVGPKVLVEVFHERRPIGRNPHKGSNDRDLLFEMRVANVASQKPVVVEFSPPLSALRFRRSKSWGVLVRFDVSDPFWPATVVRFEFLVVIVWVTSYNCLAGPTRAVTMSADSRSLLACAIIAGAAFALGIWLWLGGW
jgi:hypothetical protein